MTITTGSSAAVAEDIHSMVITAVGLMLHALSKFATFCMQIYFGRANFMQSIPKRFSNGANFMQYIPSKLANGEFSLLYPLGISNFLYANSIQYYTIAIPPQNLQLFVRKLDLVLYYCYTPIDFATFCTQTRFSTVPQLYPHRICNFLYANLIFGSVVFLY